MSAVFLTTVSAAFLLAAMVLYRSQRSSLFCDLVFGGIVAGSMLLYTLYGVANQFTGAGINEAVWFHLRYGLRGAGFAAYGSMAAVAGGGLIGGVGICFALSFWRRKPKGESTARAFVPFVLLIASGAFCPAIHDLVQLRPPERVAGSDFYEYYRTPRIMPTASAGRNLVFIYAEGLERTYFDEQRFPGLIKRLRRLEKQSTYFTDIRQVVGTGFTMGGIVASQCGIPLFTPSSGNSMAGVDLFLPGARGMGNLLHEAGYQLAFLGGAPLEFAGKGKLFRTQEFDSVEGMGELQPRLHDERYRSAWGLYDDSLFEFAFERFENLARGERPFGLFLLTLDSHHPQGHISRSAEGITYGDGRNPMLNAVAAADQLIAEFIERIRGSAAGRNTVVVLVSDHLAMGNTATKLLNQGNRRDLFMVIEPDTNQGAAIGTPGSTLDTGTTVLSFLGFEGEIGLGRNLADPATSAAERRFIQQPENLQRWREDISSFWMFPRLDGSMRVDPERREMVLNGREFSIPVLMEVEPDLAAQLTFPTDPTRLFLDQIPALPVDRPYILIERMEHLGRLHSFGGATGWCMVTEPAEGVIKILPVPESLVLSSRQISGFLADGPDPAQDVGLDLIYARYRRAQ